jgi:hypothetical protein
MLKTVLPNGSKGYPPRIRLSFAYLYIASCGAALIKPFKVAITACIRKLIVTLNAMLHSATHWNPSMKSPPLGLDAQHDPASHPHLVT